MKITFVLPYAGLQGGVRVIAVYAERLKRRGHEVFLVSTPQSAPLRRNVKSFILGQGWPEGRKEPSHIDGIGVKHKVLEQIRPVVDSDVPDADVVVATYYRTAYGVQQLSPSKGAKTIFIQGYEGNESNSNLGLDATWRMPMHKIVVSRWLFDLARDKFRDEVVSLVPNGVDLNQFHAAERGKSSVPTVGLVHHNSPLKGCDTTIKALRRVATAVPSLHVVSFGAEHPELRLRLPRFAKFHYRPAQDKIRGLYAQCDVWMCGSIVEGFSLPLLEAMACRCPVVSTRAGGPLDIIEEGVNGYLTPVGDMEALADRTMRVLNLSNDEWMKMSDAAHRTATSFSWEKSTELFEKALELAIERNRRGEL